MDEDETIETEQYTYQVLEHPEPCAVCGEMADTGCREIETGHWVCESCAEEEGIL